MKRLLLALALAASLIAPSGAQQPHNTRLGASLFYSVRGITDDWVRVGAHMGWFRQEFGADYIRVFAVLGGDTYRAPDGNYYDPWQNLHYVPNSAAWSDGIRRTALSARENGLRVHWTLVGTRYYADTPQKQLDIVRGWFAAMEGLHDSVELLEMVNEYNVNGFTREDLWRMGREARRLGGPSYPIALSSPGSTHNDSSSDSTIRAEIGSMFPNPDFGGANVFTYHASRPDNIIGPARILRLLGGVPRRNSEPRGPGASAGGDVGNPAVVCGDYRASIAAGEDGYVFHTKPGVWGGRAFGFPGENQWASVWDIPRIGEFASCLKALRSNGGAPQPPPNPSPSPGPGPAPTPTDPIAILMDLVRRVTVLEAACRAAGACR